MRKERAARHSQAGAGKPRGLVGSADGPAARPGLSAEVAEALERMATDGTLKAALDEIGTGEPDLAG